MYAVVRAGGKQYKVAPGDVIKVEKATASDGHLEFEVLAVSNEGRMARPQGETRVVGQVVEEGRGDKVLVFHYKRKKQYKKLQGHRQPFTAVRITEITYDGQKFSAPEAPAPKPKKTETNEAAGAAETVAAPKKKAGAKKATGSANPAKSTGSAKGTAPKRKK